MHLKFALLNIQCLISRRTNKLESQELEHIFQTNDLVLLTETWAGEYSDVSFPDFKIFYLSRTNGKSNTKRNSGGIAIFIREKDCTPNMQIKSDGDDILWLRLDGILFDFASDLFLCLCYVTSSDSSRGEGVALIETKVFYWISEHILDLYQMRQTPITIL